MKNLKILAALGLLSAAGAAQAGVSSTWSPVSDYDFRGITQSAQDPAIQASIDYAHDSGWYIGAWGSNIDWGPGSPHVEVDYYTGFKGGDAENGIGWDTGLIYYTYPQDTDFNSLEIYAGISHGWFSGKAFWSPDWGGDSTPGDTRAWYLTTDATVPLPQNFSIIAHVGYSGGEYWDDLGDELLDYAVGVGYTLNKFNLALKYIGTDTKLDKEPLPHDTLSAKSRVLFTVSTTFPW